MAKEYRTLDEFWPFYLEQHVDRTNQRLHVIGTTLGLLWLAGAILSRRWALIPIGFVWGYAFAWVGHFRFEKNRPATFTYPLLSLASDFRLWWHAVKGTLDDEIAKHVGQVRLADDGAGANGSTPATE